MLQITCFRFLNGQSKPIMILSFWLLFWYFCSTGCAITITAENSEVWDEFTKYSQLKSWPYLSRARAAAIRTQRDVTANVSVTYSVTPGVDLTPVVFESLGYNADSLNDFRTLLNVGVQTFILDLYYHENSKAWLLCPPERLESIIGGGYTSDYDFTECDAATFNLTSLISTLNNFLSNTNNNLNTNVMFLLLKLHSFSTAPNVTMPASLVNTNVTSLSAQFDTIDKIVSPLTVPSFNLPTMNDLLFRLGLRVFPIILENNLYDNTSYNLLDDQFTFYISLRSEKTDQWDSYNILDMDVYHIDEFENATTIPLRTQHLAFAYDTSARPFSLKSYRKSVSLGYGPIISHALDNLSDISWFLELSCWSWSPYQPTSTDIDELQIPQIVSNISDYILNAPFTGRIFQHSDMFDNSSLNFIDSGANNNTDDNNNENSDDNNEDDEYLNRCAALSKIGWIATTCDRKLPVVCQNLRNASDFMLLDVEMDYMRAVSACKAMDGRYDIGVPRNVYDQITAMNLIPEDKEFVWINLNSLASENCWVVGLNTNCPYQLVTSTHVFVKMITPSTTMAVALAVALIILQSQRVPVHKNRRAWKRRIDEFSKNDIDGVPA